MSSGRHLPEPISNDRVSQTETLNISNQKSARLLSPHRFSLCKTSTSMIKARESEL